LKKIAASATSKEKHFILLVGPRGVGKTHFVELLHHRLTTAPAGRKARAHLKIAFLNEEEWGVASLLDLLMRILATLAKNDATLGSRIDGIYSLHERDPARALEAAQALLVEHVGDGTLLLICENLKDLFDGLGAEGQKRWRAFIQEHPFWTILATAPMLFSGVQLQSSAFYGFFTIRKLDRLEFEGALDLLKRKAEHEGDPELTAKLDTPVGRARARAIHHLAGGSPRVYVIMSDFLMHQSLDQLAPPFMRMVDDLTPYYQDRVRLLAPQQRKLVEFLAHERRPLVVKDIAKRCLMSQQTAAKQLGELVGLGFVQRTPVGRKTYCELAEPLMRICFEVKDRRTEHIELFVEFLRRWFTVSELRSRYEGLKAEPPTCRPFERCHLEVAIAQSEQDGQQPVHQALAAEALRLLRTRDHEQAAEVWSRLVLERGNASDFSNLALALKKCSRLDEALEIARRGQEIFPVDARLALRHALLLYDHSRQDEALAVAQKALEANPKDIDLLCLVGTVLLAKGRFEEAISTEDRLLALDPDHSHAYFVKAACQDRLGQPDLALETATECTKRFPKEPAGWRALVAFHLERSPELALRALEKLQKIAPDDPNDLDARAHLLLHMQRLGESLTILERLATLQPENLNHRANRAMILRRLGRVAEATASSQELTKAHSDYKGGWVELGLTMNAAGDKAAALAAIERALALDPRDSYTRRVQCEVLVSLQRWTDTLAAVEAVRTACGSSFDPWNLMASETAAIVATLGAGVAKEVLAKALAATEKPDTACVVEAAGSLLSTELQLRGPAAAARALGELRATLTRHRQEGALADVFTGFVSKALGRPDVGSAQWAEALPMFASAVDGSADCSLPLEMLSVGTRYRREGDETILLTLPLEQRALLREALGLDKASDADDTRS
jgi:tetratricopeptide (TPR) repeat protein/energy-coupling factor transporter ATP-binding protein EcfA2